MQHAFRVYKDRPKISICMTRDSTCAGDDGDAPHEQEIETYTFVDPVDLIRQLAPGYLPAVAGSASSWDCLLNGVLIAVYRPHGTEAHVQYVEYSDENHLHFRYRYK